jgi:hypothetical protein
MLPSLRPCASSISRLPRGFKESRGVVKPILGIAPGKSAAVALVGMLHIVGDS